MHNNKDFFWRFSKLEGNYINSILHNGFNYRKKNFKNLLEEAWSKKFNIKYSISFNSCTSALHSSFLALGLKKKFRSSCSCFNTNYVRYYYIYEWFDPSVC